MAALSLEVFFTTPPCCQCGHKILKRWGLIPYELTSDLPADPRLTRHPVSQDRVALSMRLWKQETKELRSDLSGDVVMNSGLISRPNPRMISRPVLPNPIPLSRQQFDNPDNPSRGQLVSGNTSCVVMSIWRCTGGYRFNPNVDNLDSW